ncbi:MAG: ABC transporter permease, partial [Prevotella sp.]|nr:ABC transporter permease [Prevotella sp.]
MHFPLFVAKKIYHHHDDQHRVSRPAVKIATLGVAIGLAVMLVSVSVVLGFKHTIRDKVVGFCNHITVGNFMTV